MAGPWEKYQKSEPSGDGPWSKYSEKTPAPASKGSGAQAALESFGNAATLGYLPQLQAAAGRLMPNPSAGVDAELEAKGFKISKPDGYVQARDENIRRHAQQKADFPLATTAGSVAGAVGGGLMLPMGALAKGATLGAKALQGAKAGAAMGGLMNPGDVQGDVTLMPVERLKNAAAGGALGAAIPAAMDLLGKGAGFAAKKLSSALTGVDPGDIKTYAARTDAVNKMIKESGGDMTEASDRVRTELQSAIRSKRQSLGGEVSKALEAAPKDQSISIDPILEQLSQAKSRLNPNLKSEAVQQLDEMMKRVSNEASANGEVSIQQLNEIKEFFQERGKSAYMKEGQIFQASKEAAQAAKGAGAVARKTLNPLVPELAEANNRLAQLHSLEDSLNRNLIAPGKSDSALMAAGSGANPRNAKILGKLGDLSGYNITEQAQNLSAARSFANPSMLPVDKTGKAMARIAAGAGVGGVAAGPVGSLIGGALASPMTLKAGINAKSAISNILLKSPSVAQLAERSPGLVGRLSAALGQEAAGGKQDYSLEKDPILNDPELLMLFKKDENLLRNIDDPQRRALIKDALKRLPAGQ